MKRDRKEFKRDGYTLVVDTTSGERVVTRVRDGEAEPSSKAPRPSMVRKAANFAVAAAKHVAAGRPMATDEQVAERFAICQACPKFIEKGEGVGECSMCGCGLRAVGVEGLSKLRWATEQCPLPKPRWKALPAPPPAV